MSPLPASEPYLFLDHVDAHNHQLTVKVAPNGHHVAVQADNLVIGGDHADVWLTPGRTHELATAFREGTPFEHTDDSGDRLTVAPQPDWTVFTLTRAARDDDEEPTSVRVVILTARIPRMALSLLDAADNTKEGW